MFESGDRAEARAAWTSSLSNSHLKDCIFMVPFVYVNDVALPIPGFQGFFYRNNSGQAVVTVQRI